ncbi:MarR family winged helix-turn-helix transcriptional regulator [Microlunatus speluncae]|uniref:MarR family winged helix-turn-helix transcriptional regulator n=1 Tax=Microlunatus speluncae TaxID=2594267 RepID=UPI00137592F7|nr:MarR family winged helix-turn-helix transcriptional regulator [Microlunatus speluncae]
MSNHDRADKIIAAWQRTRPDLDPSSVAIVTRVWQLARVFGAERRRLLAGEGIDPALMDLLGALRRQDPPHALTTRELAELEGITPAAISQRLSRAEQKGWITRDPQGDRSVLVTLTDAGQAVADGVAAAIFDHDDTLLAVLDPAARRQLAELLRTMCLHLTGDTPVDHVGTGKEFDTN